MGWQGARDYAAILLMYGCGMRLAEVLGLPPTALMNIRAGSLTFVGKGNKERMVPVLPQVTTACDAYVAACPHNWTAAPPSSSGCGGAG